MHTVIKQGRIAHHTIRVYRWEYPNHDGTQYVGYSYSITGGKWSMGTLHSARETAESCWQSALAEVRRYHPRAILYITREGKDSRR